jgi:gamma-glutamyltranspeptidase/glutathione hydrolase
MIEAMRVAFADTCWYVADPQFNAIPLEQLLSKDYAALRRELIDSQKATLDQKRGTPTAASDTVYLTVVDSEGNACSFINSNCMGFGTGIVPKGWGFTLQNRGHNFTLDPDHPNVLAPGKRPYHTIIPGMITQKRELRVENGDLSEQPPSSFHSLISSFGVMGGFMQPQGHMQVVVGLIDDGLDPQAALDRPRFCITDGTAGGHVAIEDGIPLEEMSALAQRGHPVIPTTGYARDVFGRGQIILRDPDTSVLAGGSDPRADGCAMGL